MQHLLTMQVGSFPGRRRDGCSADILCSRATPGRLARLLWRQRRRFLGKSKTLAFVLDSKRVWPRAAESCESESQHLFQLGCGSPWIFLCSRLGFLFISSSSVNLSTQSSLGGESISGHCCTSVVISAPA